MINDPERMKIFFAIVCQQLEVELLKIVNGLSFQDGKKSLMNWMPNTEDEKPDAII